MWLYEAQRPWQLLPMNEVAWLKPEYRRDLARNGVVLIDVCPVGFSGTVSWRILLRRFRRRRAAWTSNLTKIAKRDEDRLACVWLDNSLVD